MTTIISLLLSARCTLIQPDIEKSWESCKSCLFQNIIFKNIFVKFISSALNIFFNQNPGDTFSVYSIYRGKSI